MPAQPTVMISNLFSQKSRIVSIDSIEQIHLQKSTTARRLTISIQPFKGVRISIPRGISFAQAEEFAHSKIDWIVKHLRRIKQVEQQHQKLKDGLLPVSRPEAKRILTSRLEELARQYGFQYNKVFIRNQTTRWGSCSTGNNINLNQKLVQLPSHIVDYVLVHELVHTRIKNHSPGFWTALSESVTAPKALSKELRKYGTGLM